MSENKEIFHLINQAKSEARSESIKRFFNKNSKTLSVLSVAVVVGAVAFAGFNIYQNSQEAKFSEIFHQSLIDQQLGDLAKAKEGLQKITDASSAPKGVKSLASLRFAALLLDEGKKAEAAAIYQKISECGGCDSYVKDLGGLLAIKVWLSDENEVKKDDILARVEKIEAGSKELRYQISEQKAFLQIQKNDLAKAYEILDGVAKNPEVAQNIKARVTDGLKMIAAKGYEPRIEGIATASQPQK